MKISDPTPKYYDMSQEELNTKLGDIVSNLQKNPSILDNENSYQNILYIKSKEKKHEKETGKPKEYLNYDEDYTYNHLAVFENQLVSPPHTYLTNHGFEEW